MIMQPPLEITTEQKLEEFYKNNIKIKENIFLNLELEEFITNVEPDKPLKYYGTKEFNAKFIKWRLDKIKELYNEVINEPDIKLTPQQQSRYRHQTIIYFSKHLDRFLWEPYIKIFVEYLIETKPTLRYLDDPEFEEAYNKYHEKRLKAEEEEEI